MRTSANARRYEKPRCRDTVNRSRFCQNRPRPEEHK